MTTPAYLRPGDTVAIVPTARAISAAELQSGIQLMESWGLKASLAQNVGIKDNQQAGTAEQRIQAFNQALTDPSVRAIWCARGGYGTVHILDGIDKAALLADPKWIVGFSDISGLHNYVHSAGMESIHAQMPFAVDKKTAESLQTLKSALFGEGYSIRADMHEQNRFGELEAEVVGGNLSVLYSLRGGRFDLDVTGKILFLEDLDELYYHLDRMFENLRTADWGVQVAGVIVGSMSAMWDKNPEDPFGKSAEQMVLRVFGNKAIPIAFGFPAGHEADNRALVFGKTAKLSVSTSGTLLSFNN